MPTHYQKEKSIFAARLYFDLETIGKVIFGFLETIPIDFILVFLNEDSSNPSDVDIPVQQTKSSSSRLYHTKPCPFYRQFIV